MAKKNEPTPYTQRPPCRSCNGAGTIQVEDPETGKTMIDTCSACGGSGKQ